MKYLLLIYGTETEMYGPERQECIERSVKLVESGVVSPEDLVLVPGGEWVITSGYIRGGVHLINTRTFATMQVFPTATPRERLDKGTYGACPGPVDPGEKEKLSAHGLAIRPGAGTVHTVYLVHHGFRESIEVFEVREDDFLYILQEEPPDELKAKCEEAARVCPKQAITIEG